MVKYFCDVCGDEIPGGENVISSRIQESPVLNGRKVMFEIMAGIDGAWNGGHLCRNCLGRAIYMYLPVEPTHE